MKKTKTSIMVDFSILGDDFAPIDITKQLTLIPTEQYQKGDLSKRNVERVESCWSINTGYVETLYLSEVFTSLIQEISGKKELLIDLKKKLDLTYKFIIVIKMEQNQKPAIFLDSSIIEFANDIKAEIDFDLYIF